AAPPSAWPAAAALGGPPASPGQAATAQTASAQAATAQGAAQGAAAPAGPAVAGSLDAATLRRAWDAVLLAVKERKKTAHAQLTTAQVLGVQGRTVTLSFTHAPIMRAFQSSTGVDVLKEAVRETLGVDLDVACVVGGADGPSGGGHEPAAPRDPGPRPAPRYDSFAPGDEAEPEDPDAPAPPPQVSGEDAALRLVQSELGGKVVSSD
ncbi:MAG: polymerase subunit gamma/tau, partial [Frankiales bacterium]|nr:polymerase subunit gamma/tau [Frankiales bacterium]